MTTNQFVQKLDRSLLAVEHAGTRWLLMICILYVFCGGFLAAPLRAAPPDIRVNKVVNGTAKLRFRGDDAIIRAGNNAIINYDRFNVANGSMVRFIQPNSSSRVLNRILSTDPSYINGVLRANGRVYFVNPAGIIFGPNSVINVGHLYAAAANITDQRFLANRNQFTNAQGAVINQGLITADAAYLVGKQVGNYGTIVADKGIVAMAAGDEIYLGEKNGRVIVRVRNYDNEGAGGESGSSTPPGGSSPPGSPDEPLPPPFPPPPLELPIEAGDVYSLAIRQAGSIRATQVTLNGGASGVVKVSGSIDASNLDSGQMGGRVKILGDDIRTRDLTINASGDARGGKVWIGGGLHGQDSIPTSTRTQLGSHTRVYADALSYGRGGDIIIWSDEITSFKGKLFARARGDYGGGGFAEVSSGQYLRLAGRPFLHGARGKKGRFLIDPGSVTIIRSDDTGLSGPNTFSDSYIVDILNTGGADVTISTENATNGLAETLTVEGPQIPVFGNPIDAANITWNSANDLTLIGRDAIFMDGIISNAGTGSLTLQSTGAPPPPLVGGFGGSIFVTGTINMTGSGSVTLSGGDVFVNSDITLSGGDFNATGLSFNVQLGAGGPPPLPTIATGGGDADLNFQNGINNAIFNTAGGAVSVTGEDINTITINSGGGDVTLLANDFGIHNINVDSDGGNVAFNVLGDAGIGNVTVASAGGSVAFTAAQGSDSENLNVNSGGGNVSFTGEDALIDSIFTNTGNVSLAARSSSNVTVSPGGTGHTLTLNFATHFGVSEVAGPDGEFFNTVNFTGSNAGGGTFSVSNGSITWDAGQQTLEITGGNGSFPNRSFNLNVSGFSEVVVGEESGDPSPMSIGLGNFSLVTNAGSVRLADDPINHNANALTVNATSTFLQIDGDVTTAGAQTYTGNASALAGGPPQRDITIGGNLTAKGITLNGSTELLGENGGQTLNAGIGKLQANGLMNKTTAGDLTLMGTQKIDLNGDVAVDAGNLEVVHAFNASGDLAASAATMLMANGRFDGDGTQMIGSEGGSVFAAGKITKITGGDMMIQGASGIDLRGNVTNNAGSLEIMNDFIAGGHIRASQQTLLMGSATLDGTASQTIGGDFADSTVVAMGSIIKTTDGALRIQGQGAQDPYTQQGIVLHGSVEAMAGNLHIMNNFRAGGETLSASNHVMLTGSGRSNFTSPDAQFIHSDNGNVTVAGKLVKDQGNLEITTPNGSITLHDVTTNSGGLTLNSSEPISLNSRYLIFGDLTLNRIGSDEPPAPGSAATTFKDSAGDLIIHVLAGSFFMSANQSLAVMQGRVEIDAAGDITVGSISACKDIDLDAGHNINIHAGSELTAGGQVKLVTGNHGAVAVAPVPGKGNPVFTDSDGRSASDGVPSDFEFFRLSRSLDCEHDFVLGGKVVTLSSRPLRVETSIVTALAGSVPRVETQVHRDAEVDAATRARLADFVALRDLYREEELRLLLGILYPEGAPTDPTAAKDYLSASDNQEALNQVAATRIQPALARQVIAQYDAIYSPDEQRQANAALLQRAFDRFAGDPTKPLTDVQGFRDFLLSDAEPGSRELLENLQRLYELLGRVGIPISKTQEMGLTLARGLRIHGVTPSQLQEVIQGPQAMAQGR